MQSIVPIIGCEFVDNRPLLKERIEFLLDERGYDTKWVDEENIVWLRKSSQSHVHVPIIIDLVESSFSVNHPDLLIPLIDQFSSAKVIAEKIENIPAIIFLLQPQLSLWESPPPVTLIRMAIDYIYQNLHRTDLSVEEIAHHAFVSKYKLESQFKEWCGSGVWHFVQHVRMQQAKRLLLESSDPIAEISFLVGYGDLPQFDKVFKKVFNLTPHKYRLEMRSIDQKDKFFNQKDKFFSQND